LVIIIRVTKSRAMRCGWDVACIGEMRTSYNILVGKPEGKSLLERTRRRGKDDKMDLRDIGWEGVDCMHLVQDRNQWRALVNTAMTLLVL